MTVKYKTALDIIEGIAKKAIPHFIPRLNASKDQRVIRKQTPIPIVVKNAIEARMALVEGNATLLIRL